MTANRLTLVTPLFVLALSLPALAAETAAEKELEAASFANSESQGQEQEEKAVVKKMEADDAEAKGQTSGGEAPVKSGETGSK